MGRSIVRPASVGLHAMQCLIESAPFGLCDVMWLLAGEARLLAATAVSCPGETLQAKLQYLQSADTDACHLLHACNAQFTIAQQGYVIAWPAMTLRCIRTGRTTLQVFRWGSLFADGALECTSPEYTQELNTSMSETAPGSSVLQPWAPYLVDRIR